jgi:tetratricopeptide (TPR) repeat protein
MESRNAIADSTISLLEQLMLLDRLYFKADREVVLKQWADEILSLIKTLETEFSQTGRIDTLNRILLSHLRSSLALYSGQNIDEAIRDAVTCVKLEPSNALYWSILGEFYYALKDFEAATLCFEKGLQAKPTSRAYVNLSTTLRASLESVSEKERDLLLSRSRNVSTQATIISPESSLSWYSLGLSNLISFRYTSSKKEFLLAARDHMKKASALQEDEHSSSTPLREICKKLHLSSLLNPDISYNLGHAYSLLQEYQLALQRYEESKALDASLAQNTSNIIDSIRWFTTYTWKTIDKAKDLVVHDASFQTSLRALSPDSLKRSTVPWIQKLVKNNYRIDSVKSLRDQYLRDISSNERRGSSSSKPQSVLMLCCASRTAADLEPYSMFMADQDSNFVLVSIHGINFTFAKELSAKRGLVFAVLNPTYAESEIITEEKESKKLPLIQIFSLESILVQGVPLQAMSNKGQAQ